MIVAVIASAVPPAAPMGMEPDAPVEPVAPCEPESDIFQSVCVPVPLATMQFKTSEVVVYEVTWQNILFAPLACDDAVAHWLA